MSISFLSSKLIRLFEVIACDFCCKVHVGQVRSLEIRSLIRILWMHSGHRRNMYRFKQQTMTQSSAQIYCTISSVNWLGNHLHNTSSTVTQQWKPGKYFQRKYCWINACCWHDASFYKNVWGNPYTRKWNANVNSMNFYICICTLSMKSLSRISGQEWRSRGMPRQV